MSRGALMSQTYPSCVIESGIAWVHWPEVQSRGFDPDTEVPVDELPEDGPMASWEHDA